MKTLTISAKELAELSTKNTDKIGSSDWAIYIDSDSRLDVRHNTEYNNNWYKIADFYSWWPAEDFADSSIDEIAYWLQHDGINVGQIEDEINEIQRINDEQEIELEWK